MTTSALAREVDELQALAAGLADGAPEMAKRLDAWHALAAAARTAAEADELASLLRRLWLDLAHKTAQAASRTPLARDHLATPTGRAVPFGYERDLTPDALEARAASFVPPPAGWTARALLFGSGQSALAAILLDLIGRIGSRRVRVAHVGTYFETADLLRLFGVDLVAIDEADPALATADLLIVEPTMLADTFRCLDLTALQTTMARHGAPPLIVLDATLSHLRFPVQRVGAALGGTQATTIIRMSSMLKLDQGGFELANAGLVSLFATPGDDTALEDLGDRLVKIRSTTGTGLAFADVCALDVPWFLDPAGASAYSAAIFAHNEALARRLDGHPLFAAVLHPALCCAGEDWAVGPFVVLKLADPSPERYARLAAAIETRAEQSGILLRKGGSFGFRLHRFEIVEPEGEAAFLRIALGASALGADAAIDLLAALTEDDLAA